MWYKIYCFVFDILVNILECSYYFPDVIFMHIDTIILQLRVRCGSIELIITLLDFSVLEIL